jgi:hypothetical protein
MNIKDHFSESLEKVFWLKILKLFDTDGSESGIFLTTIRDGKIQIRDPA